MKRKCTLLFSLFFLLSTNVFSQLTVNSGLSGQELADILAGENITATNVSVSGNSLQYGSFSLPETAWMSIQELSCQPEAFWMR